MAPQKLLGPDKVFGALSDLTRVRIINLLSKGELCVCDLVELLKIPQPTASRHLAYLRRANWVATEKRGFWTFYALKPTSSWFMIQILKSISVAADEVSILKKDLQSRSKLKKRPQSCC
ncbi:MAG: metalloregulator ArsR/SmtB family transcription factor [Verrucomicrobiota bacterium]|nr:metalloregulator ArsR/SmtB family transcription factor [Verrucomicrobiota bacterium]